MTCLPVVAFLAFLLLLVFRGFANFSDGFDAGFCHNRNGKNILKL